MSDHETAEKPPSEELDPTEVKLSHNLEKNETVEEINDELAGFQSSEKLRVEEISAEPPGVEEPLAEHSAEKETVEASAEKESEEPPAEKGAEEASADKEPEEASSTEKESDEAQAEAASEVPIEKPPAEDVPIEKLDQVSDVPPSENYSEEPLQEAPSSEAPQDNQPSQVVEVEESKPAEEITQDEEAIQQETDMDVEKAKTSKDLLEPSEETDGQASESVEPKLSSQEVDGEKLQEEVKEAADEDEVQEEVKQKEGEIEKAEGYEDFVIRLVDRQSHTSFHDLDLPEIRGLAELEYQLSEEVVNKEPSFEDLTFTKRQSVRASLATKLYSEAEEEEERQMLRRQELARTRATPTTRGEQEIFLEPEFGEVRKPAINRPEFYELHEKNSKEYLLLKVKNKFLQRKMSEHFKRRKMEHVLKEEADVPPETTRKYERKLERLADLQKGFKSETDAIREDTNNLQKKRDSVLEELNSLFSKVTDREIEIGTGLISTKTGKEISDKVIKHLVRQQTFAIKQIAELRLKFIRQRNEQTEKNAELKSLDNIGEDLSLMDYEQLKIENRSLSDKLEEREEELAKLRKKCTNTVQVMAHVREKSAALDADMDMLKELFEEVREEYIEIRERLNTFKTERDIIRNKTMKLKSESGLLTKPKLLIDMETSMEEAKIYEQNLRKIKDEYNFTTRKIRILRKNIAYEIMMNRKPQKEKKSTNKVKYFSIRPTLFHPQLPKNIFDKLEDRLQTE